MTPEELKEIKERADKATPGPWDNKPASSDWLNNKEANAEFCRHARTDIPKLVAEIDRLREALKFYANENYWDRYKETMFPGVPYVVVDNGRRARAALGEEEK